MKNIDPFKAKQKLRGSKVGFGTFFKSKDETITCKNLYRLSRIFKLGSYDSSKANSLDDSSKILTCTTSLKWRIRDRYCFVFRAQFFGGYGLQLLVFDVIRTYRVPSTYWQIFNGSDQSYPSKMVFFPMDLRTNANFKIF